jgi:hypothetical protein
VGQVGLGRGPSIGLGTAGDEHVRVVGAQSVAVVEKALQRGPADRVQRHRVRSLALISFTLTSRKAMPVASVT